MVLTDLRVKVGINLFDNDTRFKLNIITVKLSTQFNESCVDVWGLTKIANMTKINKEIFSYFFKKNLV